MRRNKIFLFFLLAALGIFLRLNNLAGRSLWTDEFFTLFDSTGHGTAHSLLASLSQDDSPRLFQAKDFKVYLRSDPAKTIKDVNYALIKEDTHPPLYFWIIYFWIKLFGDSALAVRLFSVLMGLVCVYLAYRLSRRLFNEEAAVSCALFLAISPFAVRYAQEARSYALVMAIALAASLSILRFEKSNKVSDLTWFAVLNTVGIFTHYFYIFVSLAHFLYFSFAYGRNNSLRLKLYVAFVVSVLVFFFWFIIFGLRQYNFIFVKWPFGHPIPLSERALDVFRGAFSYFLIYRAPGMPFYLLPLGWLIFIYILAKARKELIGRYRRQMFFCLSILFLPIAGLFFIDLIQNGVLLRQERFWVFSFLGFIPLAGYILGAGLLRQKFAAYLLIILLLVSSSSVSAKQFGPAPKYASAWINARSAGQPCGVITNSMRSVVAAQSYYLDDDTYLVPVASQRQMDNGIKMLSGLTGKIFIARHYHPTNPYLMDASFMAAGSSIGNFRFEAAVEKDYISVSEYINADYDRKI